MKAYTYIKYTIAAATAVTLASCSDFLDQLPDERTDLDTEDKVEQLLMTSYPVANYSWLCELSSDNLIDNQAPHMPSGPWDKQILSHYNYSAYSRMDDELYRFDPAESATYSDSDSPGEIWENYYNSIARANAALEALESFRDQEGHLTQRQENIRSEALLLRAYCHFILVNVFSQAYKDEEASKNDIGIPYVTERETELRKEYDRGNVTDTYKKIGEDLEEGLKNVTDNYYKAPKYHFNTNAAHAFAARYYLYKRNYEKVIEHANYVLGTDSASAGKMMMNYAAFANCSSSDDYANAWHSPDRNNNLLLLTTYSLYDRRCFGYRYSLAGQVAREVLMIHSSPLWSTYSLSPIGIVGGFAWSNSSADYGFFTTKVGEHFEYSNKLAGIGYVHTIVRAFTSNNLLLERAEANIMLGNIEAAQNDLRWYWNCSIDNFSDTDKQAYLDPGYIKYMTNDIFDSYYGQSDKINCFDNWDFTQKNVSSSFVVSSDKVKYMNCLNDFRRFENCNEGLRFFDLKRWGIEWTHHVGNESTEYLMKGNDVRRAIELPWESLSAGMDSSRPTSNVTDGPKPENDTRKFRIPEQ
ncbi:MAG: RagB/SusD family nutrient uptake outer membrane protein [Prevotella sp.]|nr:RagB/SusD family nutrient uptake outer membrane protein [Prevotella sp.]